MGKSEWNRYFRLSLFLHLVFLSVGGALLYAHRSLPEKIPRPIRVHLAEPISNSAGTGGDRAAGMDMPEDALGREGKTAPERKGTRTREALLEQLLDAPSLVSEQGTVQTPGGEKKVSKTPSGALSDSPSGGTGQGPEMGQDGGNGDGPGNGDSGETGGSGPSGQDLSCDATLLPFDKEYPPASRKAGEEGIPVVGVVISAEGNVTAARLEESSGYDRLDRAALKVAWKWQFLPARDASGNPISCRKSISIRYVFE